MRFALLAFAATLGVSAQTTVIDGTWKATFTAPGHEWPKTVSEVILKLKVDGNRLRGTAQMGNWPGIMPLINGWTDGERISFTVISKLAWRREGPGLDASGLPIVSYTGTLRGDKLELHLIWDSIMLYGEPGLIQEYDLIGAKLQE